MSEQKVLIDCRDAALGYEGRPIWEHLTFQVRRGDYLCIVGDNGSGKSTLLKSMLGLLRPLSGEIRLDESLRRGAIGYLPQQTRAQKDFPATVSEVVLSGFLSARGWKFFYTPAQKSQALQHMGKLGILELKDKCYRELSGGQQQRVLLARALCAAGDLLVLDETLYALKAGILERSEVEELMDAARRARCHLVLSGRDAPDWLVEAADLVTEMGEIKHPWRAGIKAAPGIEF